MSLLQFTDLGDDTWLYEPRKDGDDGNGQGLDRDRQNTIDPPPALIILCTWLGGATTKRIERYTKGYRRLWPRSSILLIRTTLRDFLVRSTTSLHRKLRPAHREIRRLAQVGQLHDQAPSVPDHGNILLHIFSQGGTNMATELVRSTNAILSTLGAQEPLLPLRQIVFDSCPGDPGIHSTCAAGAHSLPDVSLLRPLGVAVLYLMAAGMAGMEATGLRIPLARMMRSQLNDPRIFSPRASRLYLTSEADEIVDSRQVEEHRQQAEAKGLRTDMLRFHRAAHCSLVMENDAAYWNAIASAWQRGADPKDGRRTAAHGGHAGASCFPHVSSATCSHPRSRL